MKYSVRTMKPNTAWTSDFQGNAAETKAYLRGRWPNTLDAFRADAFRVYGGERSTRARLGGYGHQARRFGLVMDRRVERMRVRVTALPELNQGIPRGNGNIPLRLMFAAIAKAGLPWTSDELPDNEAMQAHRELSSGGATCELVTTGTVPVQAPAEVRCGLCKGCALPCPMCTGADSDDECDSIDTSGHRPSDRYGGLD